MHQSLWWRGFESHICHFFDIPIQSIVSCILITCRWYLLPSWMLLTTKHTGRIAEWSKALVLVTSHFGGVGLCPTLVILLTFLYEVLFPLFWTPAHVIFYHDTCYWPHNIQAGWLSGLRHWFKAPVTSVSWVWFPLLWFCWHPYTKYCFPYFEHLHMVSSTIIHSIDLITYRQDGWVV